MLRTLSLLLLTIVATANHAAIDSRRDPWIQVDVLLFRHGALAPLAYDELWAVQAPKALPADLIDGLNPGGTTVRALGLDNGPLATTAERMLNSSRYRLLLQESLQMPKAGERNAPSIRLHSGQSLPVVPSPQDPQDNDPEDLFTLMPAAPVPPPLAAVHETVDGWFRVWIDTFIFLEFDLTATETLHDAIPTQVDFVGEPAYSELQVQQFPVTGRRRVRYEEVQYFDHPEFGVLLYIREIPEPDTL